MTTLKVVLMNVVMAAVVFTLSIGATLIVVKLTGSWDYLARGGVEAYDLTHPEEVLLRSKKRGM